MALVSIVRLPCDAMSSKRPNLTLDEQSFQGLLSAAFTIQEHNERLKQARQAPADPVLPQEAEAPPIPEDHIEPEATSVCPQCGAEKPADRDRCESCAGDELRPGERLQRNWASMWMMSQEKGLWPERSPETRESAEVEKGDPPLAAQLKPQAQPLSNSSVSAAPAPPVLDDRAEQPAPGDRSLDRPNFRDPALDDLTLDDLMIDEPAPDHAIVDQTAGRGAWSRTASAEPAQENWAPEYPDGTSSDGAVLPVPLPAREDLSPAGAGNGATGSSLQRIADWRVTLRIHRADIYLGVALFVAVLALLWPAAGPPRRAALSLWDKSLIELGIAEAPAPVVHLQGDPAIQVWIDPHTALYYCPGTEQYGKTANGRLSSQRDAQMDRFEPAGRTPCE